MKRSSIVAAIAVLLFSEACSSGGGGTSAAQTTPPSATTGSSATVSPGVQTAIPDGVYRTRPRTEQDLVALGLSKAEIEAAKENEQWHDTIVYELRVSGDKFLLSTARDGGKIGGVEDQGTFVVHGQTLDMTYVDGEPEYRMQFSVSDGELRLKLVKALCAETDPEHCSDFLVRAAYEALPFEAVS
jgi:hypothetical protein